MNCEKCLELISAQLDGELPAGERQELEAHLASCGACRASAEELRAQDSQLRAAFSPRRQSAAVVAERAIARIHRETAPTRRIPWISLTFAAAAGFFLAILLLRESAVPAAKEQLPQGSTFATLSKRIGLVEQMPKGSEDWQVLPIETSVFQNSYVKTDLTAQCELITPETGIVRLNRDSAVHFPSSRTLEFGKGEMWLQTYEGLPPMRLVAETHKLLVYANSVVDLRFERDDLRIFVVAGKAVLEGVDKTALQQGEAVRFRKDKLIDRQNSTDLLLETSWIQELLLLDGPESDELSERVIKMVGRLRPSKMVSSYLEYETAIRSLGEGCAPGLLRSLRTQSFTKEQDLRVHAARILADFASPWNIPDLIGFLYDPNEEIRFYAAKGLSRLTGRHEGGPPEQWRDRPLDACRVEANSWEDWWKANKNRYPSAPNLFKKRSSPK